jgi:huntingtin-interacting protein 1-related protein
LEEYTSKRGELSEDHELALREKDEEIEVYKSGMEQALMELEELKLVCFFPRSYDRKFY